MAMVKLSIPDHHLRSTAQVLFFCLNKLFVIRPTLFHSFSFGFTSLAFLGVGDVCKGDIVLFNQRVYEMYQSLWLHNHYLLYSFVH